MNFLRFTVYYILQRVEYRTLETLIPKYNLLQDLGKRLDTRLISHSNYSCLIDQEK